jgi:hypothetical protein
MNIGHWEFSKEFDPSDFFGFIYRITELNTGREYIGKKQFTKMQRKVVKGRKNRKIVHSESNWKTYTGSSVELNAQIILNGIDNYKFEIMSLHKSKGSLYYAEVEAHVFENVLRAKLPNGDRKYFNKQIAAVKFLPPDELLIESEMKNTKI